MLSELGRLQSQGASVIEPVWHALGDLSLAAKWTLYSTRIQHRYTKPTGSTFDHLQVFYSLELRNVVHWNRLQVIKS